MNRRMGLVFALVLGLGASRAEPATLQKVAVDGDPAPDPGSFYRRKFLQPAVSDAAGAHVVASARIFINRTCLVKFDAAPTASSSAAGTSLQRDTSSPSSAILRSISPATRRGPPPSPPDGAACFGATRRSSR